MSWNFFQRKQDWILSGDDKFLDAMMFSRGEDDAAFSRQVARILRRERVRQYFAGWIALMPPVVRIWRNTHGRYWKSRAALHSSTASSTSGSPGATGFPVSGATFAATTPITAPITAGGTFEDAGIRAGEVVAYRCWQLRDGYLWSVFVDDFKWEPDVTQEGDPTEPMQGIHAFKNRLDACQYINWRDGSDMVSGTVYLWGDVYEHERGYRASKARIASIDDSPYYDAAELRKTYNLGSPK